jgi:RecB family exonuclease
MELEALRAVLFPALKATPTIPDRTGESGEAVSPAEVARGLQAFLRRVPGGRGPDRTARAEVARILERVSATLIRRTEFRAAVSILRGHLDIRVRPEIVGDDVDGSGAPWASMGGAVHLSDLEHGGFSGRRATFLVGMDADRVPGGGSQDPVLLDGDRRVLGDGLPTSSELLRERMYRVAALFARLRGQVTLSYGAWQATEARSVGASSVLLQAHRLARMDATPTFGDLHQALGRIVSAIPRQGTPALDRDDVWMAALGSDSVMRRGVEAVRRSFPELDAGLAALYERRTGTPGPVHGVVVPRPELMDPRRNESLVLSASRLEALGSCPLRYLHSSVLRIYPPDDPELDPDVWLGHRERGSLLHEVYDGALRASKEAGIRPDDAAFERLALVVLDRCIDRMRRELPTPGEGTLARETAALREDVRSFVRLIRDQSPNSIALELRFGLGEDEPLALALAGGTVRIRGAIDRVDEDLAGLHVVDYKTGVPRDFEKGVFHGGRRLQHAVYAMAAERRLRGEVVDGQYHFPTRRGQNQVFSFPRGQLGSVLELLDIMMEGVAAGHFVPSDDASDCSYCDFAEVCRVRRGEYGSATSSLAAWAEEHFNAGLQPAFRQLKQVRGFEG